MTGICVIIYAYLYVKYIVYIPLLSTNLIKCLYKFTPWNFNIYGTVTFGYKRAWKYIFVSPPPMHYAGTMGRPYRFFRKLSRYVSMGSDASTVALISDRCVVCLSCDTGHIFQRISYKHWTLFRVLSMYETEEENSNTPIFSSSSMLR
jgi:hypothetical protein